MLESSMKLDLVLKGKDFADLAHSVRDLSDQVRSLVSIRSASSFTSSTV